MNTKAIGAASQVICSAMGRNQVPATIAVALDAKGLLASPEAAAEIVELRTMLEIAERRNVELAAQLEKYVGHEPTVAEEMTYLNGELSQLRSALAERDEQIAGLLADEPTLDDEQAGVPL